MFRRDCLNPSLHTSRRHFCRTSGAKILVPGCLWRRTGHGQYREAKKRLVIRGSLEKEITKSRRVTTAISS